MVLNLLKQIHEYKELCSQDTAHKSTGWRSSSLGSCLRGQFLARALSGDFKVKHDETTQDIFELGNMTEEKLIDKLTEWQDEYFVITQGEMSEPNLNLKGHFDVLLIHKETGTAYMVECKSKNSTAFIYMDKKKEGANAHHKLQIHSYMHMVNNYGFILSEKQHDRDVITTVKRINQETGEIELIEKKLNAEIQDWLYKNASMEITNEYYQDGQRKINYNLNSKIKTGHILYISKNDQKKLEYIIFASDTELLQEWQKELQMLNYAWENQEVLPPNPINSWQSKYCMYCKAGLCSSLDDKQVVVDLFAVIKEQEKKQDEDIAKQIIKQSFKQ